MLTQSTTSAIGAVAVGWSWLTTCMGGIPMKKIQLGIGSKAKKVPKYRRKHLHQQKEEENQKQHKRNKRNEWTPNQK